jgi:hypothetical protein
VGFSESRHVRIAYRLLRIAALEDRIKLLARKYPKVPESDIREVSKLDPTGGKFLEMLVRNLALGYPAAAMHIFAPALSFYERVRKSPALLDYTGLPADVNKVGLLDLYRKHQEYGDQDLVTKSQKFKVAKERGAKVVYDQDPYKIIKIGGPGVDKDEAITAACTYARNTKWCTSDKGSASKYLSRGPLFIVFRNGEKILQTDGKDFQNVLNEPINVIQERDLLDVLIKAGLLETPRAALEFAVRMAPIAEGSLEWRAWGPTGKRVRLTELEPIIAKDPTTSLEYARFIGERFPLGEKAIASDAGIAFQYVVSVLFGPFPEAEETLKNSDMWQYYQNYINYIRDRPGSVVQTRR